MHPTTCPSGQKVTSLLDADIIAFRAACVQQSDDLEEHETRACTLRIAQAWSRWGQEAICCFSKGRSFRYDAYPDYKSNRKDKPKPPALKFCQQVLRDNYPVQEKDTWEADDVLGVLATCGHYECPLIVTIDKDLRQVPGWHWNPDKEQWPIHVTREHGEFLRHSQWLSGDPGDGYGGIPKMGPVKAEKALQEALEDNLSLTSRVLLEYEQNGLDDAYRDAMLTCCKILQTQ